MKNAGTLVSAESNLTSWLSSWAGSGEGTLNYLGRHSFINSYNLAGKIADRVAMLFYSNGTLHAICSSERSNEQVHSQ